MSLRLTGATVVWLAYSITAAAVGVEQPARAFGYVIGDTLEQRIDLGRDGKIIELTELPVEQRVDVWLSRIIVDLESRLVENDTLRLRYQIINAPDNLITAELPALVLNATSGPPLQVAAWPISISALTLTDVNDDGELSYMQPDRLPSSVDTKKPARNLLVSAWALIASLLLWGLWWFWRNHSDAIQLPFARALKTLKNLNHQDRDTLSEAWLAMHRAFNGSAGQTIHASSIGTLIQRQPWLKDSLPQIEAFYQASSQRFFQQADTSNSFPLYQLCKTLHQAEKRQAVGQFPDQD